VPQINFGGANTSDIASERPFKLRVSTIFIYEEIQHMNQAALKRERKATSAFRNRYLREAEEFMKQPLDFKGTEPAKLRSMCGSTFDCGRTCTDSSTSCSTGDWGGKQC